ncbi:MAG: Rne/Rng family ribonuclease [Alphaproteobacteria bacterium]|jgi:ribonuclease E|nr:Rne/Rng family ribonuclease [Alphaproteobacteria bacterium]
MAKKMLIDATHAEETRVVVVDGNKVEEFDFETQSRRQLAGNIYLAKVTRVEPSLQAAFVDYGGNRHGFLAFSEIHPDYYQIPTADREALLAEEKAYAEAMKAEAEAEDEEKPKPRRRRSRAKPKPAATEGTDAVISADPETTAEDSPVETPEEETSGDIEGMQVLDGVLPDVEEGSSPMESVAETPVETPAADEEDEADTKASDATAKDDSIESVAVEDDSEEVRPVRKPRPRRYKIQEVIKVRQVLLVQVVKEERGNKGAALTTYLSLAGRYCVLMPNTARGGGISRKITNAADRKKLKAIAGEMDVPEGAGLIIRTAGSQRTKTEIKRDYEYLQRLWEQIRELTLKSIAPAPIYEEGNLIKRSIRDLYNKEIDEVLVEGDVGYRTAKDFMKMIMPSHAKNVKHYTEGLPLFARYQVEGYLGNMFNPTVQLPSGGYIVIGVTEALVAIDVNSGRATKEGSIEQTATKTNLEAADEVARQLRLRDLAGLIVIDFIDMDERKNNAAVEKRMKERLKTDRARIQVGRISGFGLMEMSRQRLRPGMLEATTQPCPHCHGTGLLRSDDNVALAILRQVEEEGVRGRTREVLIKAPVNIVNYLMNQKREHVAQIEARYGLSVRLEADVTLVSPDYQIEKFKQATRNVAEVEQPVISSDTAVMAEVEDEAPAAPQPEPAAEGEEQPKKKRRRRRRRRKSNGGAEGQNGEQTQADSASEDSKTSAAPQEAANVDAPADEAAEKNPKPKRTRTRRKKTEAASEAQTDAAPAEASETPEAEENPKPKRTRTRRKKTEAAPEAQPDAAPAEASETPEAEEKPKPKRTRTRKKKTEAAPDETADQPAKVDALEAAPDEQAPAKAPAPAEKPAEPVAAETKAEDKPDEAAKPKRRGWWALGR